MAATNAKDNARPFLSSIRERSHQPSYARFGASGRDLLFGLLDLRPCAVMVEEGLTTCKPKGLPPALHIRLKLDEARARATRKVAGGWGAPASRRETARNWRASWAFVCLALGEKPDSGSAGRARVPSRSGRARDPRSARRAQARKPRSRSRRLLVDEDASRRDPSQPSWRRAAIWPVPASPLRRRSWRGCYAADREPALTGVFTPCPSPPAPVRPVQGTRGRPRNRDC